jgi:hypothetical protein
MSTRVIAVAAAVILALALGIALLYVMRSQAPPAIPAGSGSPTATAATATTPAPTGSTNPPTPTVVASLVRCGMLAANSITSGQGSGPNTFELRSPTGVSIARFGWPGSGQPALGTYICVRLIAGAPIGGFGGLVGPGEPGYIASSWAATCGTVSDLVASTSTAGGSFVLSSPGRAPLKVALSAANPPPGELSGYICASIYGTGAPMAFFAGLWPPATAGFIPEGTLPATKASPSPDGFALPQSCIYIAPPVVGTDQKEWSIDCGATANRDARGTLAPVLTQQGWTSCGSVTATATWAKGTTRLLIVESSGSPGDYPRIVQPVRPAASSSCP